MTREIKRGRDDGRDEKRTKMGDKNPIISTGFASDAVEDNGIPRYFLPLCTEYFLLLIALYTPPPSTPASALLEFPFPRSRCCLLDCLADSGLPALRVLLHQVRNDRGGCCIYLSFGATGPRALIATLPDSPRERPPFYCFFFFLFHFSFLPAI